jgi:hypothetical protein
MPRKFLLFLACWAAAAVVAAIALAALKPIGPLKWVLWAIAVIPAGLLVNAIVDGTARLFMSLPGMKQGTKYFESRAEGKEFSAPRAAWYAFAALLGFIAVIAISSVAVNAYQTVTELIAQDKCLDQGGRWNVTTQTCEHQAR